MSNLGDIAGANANAMNKVGGMLGLLADISGAIGLVQLTYDEVQGLTGSDLSLQDVLNAIQTEFRRFARGSVFSSFRPAVTESTIREKQERSRLGRTLCAASF